MTEIQKQTEAKPQSDWDGDIIPQKKNDFSHK